MKTIQFIGWLVLAGTLCSCSRPHDSCRVQYRVTGTARAALVKYRLPQGDTEQRTVSLPFKSDKYWFRIRALAAIQAQNSAATGDLRAEILIDGAPAPRLAYTTNAYDTVSISWLVGAR